MSYIATVKPDLVAISGDLTQRARPREFSEARRFVERLSGPTLVVPGNHDIPSYNLFSRFVRPLHQYRRHISKDVAPFFVDDEIAVMGINTARSLTTKYGRISKAQIAAISARYQPVGDDVTKIVVTHHPFDLPENYSDRRQLVGRSAAAMAAIARSGVDLILSGHLHLAHTALSAARYKVEGHSALVVQAGTAISTRGRGEANSFNLLRVDSHRIAVERVLWNTESHGLELASRAEFVRSEGVWRARDCAGG
jgi:3',5'-cyclic AMP phosphodiesterase CpdA